MTSTGIRIKIEDLYIGMEIINKNQLSVQFIGRETNA